SLLRSRYRLRPSDLRRRVSSTGAAEVLTFQLGFRPPLDWDRMLDFLSKRSIDGVEQIDGCEYRRTVRLVHGGKQHARWIAASPSKRRPAGEAQPSASLSVPLPPSFCRRKNNLPPPL